MLFLALSIVFSKKLYFLSQVIENCQKGSLYSMDIFSNRPLFTSCMLFIGCSVLGYFIPGNAKLIIISLLAVGLIVSLVLILAKRYSAERKHLLLCTSLCILMATLSLTGSFLHYDTVYKKRAEMDGKTYSVDATVTSVRSQTNFVSNYVVEVLNVNNEKDTHKALLVCEYSAALRTGDRITVNATASLPNTTPGRYDEKTSLHSDNIFVIYTSENEDGIDVVEYASDDLTFEGINYDLSSILTNSIGGEEGNLASALLLGNKDLLQNATQRDFRRAGASHILALSGLHMSIIMGIAMFIMKRLTRKRWLIAITLSIFAVVYLGITGFSLSATRAVIMLLVVYLSMLISGVPDSLTSLSIAGTLIMLFSPGAVADAGFWMSFSATLGILVFLPPVNDFFNQCLSKYDDKFKHSLYKALFSIITAFVTGLAAILPLLAVTCIFTKELSYASAISSVVLAIPTTVIIFLSLILLPLHTLPFISEIIVKVIKIMSNIMFDWCAYVSEMEDVVVSLNYPFAILMAIVLASALLYSFIIKRNNPFTSLVPFAVCLTLFIGTMAVYEYQNQDKLKVSYINASSNSDMLVLSNERDVVFCDISNGSKSTYRVALDEMYETRATEIDVIMLTRYTNQHNATLFYIFETNRVREVWLPTPQNSDEYSKMERLYEYAAQNSVDVFLYDLGDSLYAFEHTTIQHINDYIDRSTVPVSVLTVFTGKEQLTYAAPALNETEIVEQAEFYFSKSKHVIFGNRGPKTKTEYTIQNMDKIRSVAFADEIRAGFFIIPERSLASYYVVSEEMEYYLDK